MSNIERRTRRIRNYTWLFTVLLFIRLIPYVYNMLAGYRPFILDEAIMVILPFIMLAAMLELSRDTLQIVLCIWRQQRQAAEESGAQKQEVLEAPPLRAASRTGHQTKRRGRSHGSDQDERLLVLRCAGSRRLPLPASPGSSGRIGSRNSMTRTMAKE